MGDLSYQAKVIRIAGVIIAALFYVVTLVINYMSASLGKEIGWFLNSTGGVSDYYNVEITPAGYAFTIWALIYMFQAALLIYLIVNFFRKTERGTRVIFDPDVFSSKFIYVYAFSYIFNSCWIFLFDRSIANVYLLCVACAFLWSILVCLAIAIVISYLDLQREATNMEEYDLRADIWAIRILAQNGISMYATWCAVASPLNVAIALTYAQKMSDQDACTVALVILSVEILVYVSLDTFLLDRWTRYTITPHLVLVWALTASVVKNYVPGKRNSIFTVVLLAIAVFAVLEKVVLIIYRRNRSSAYDGKYTFQDSENSSIQASDNKQSLP